MYAGIYVLVPYILVFIFDFIFRGLPDDQSTFFYKLIVLSPLLPISNFLPQPLYDVIFDNDLFLFTVFPFLSFLVWYPVSCKIAFHNKDRRQYRKVSLGFFFLLCALYLLPLYFPEVFP